MMQVSEAVFIINFLYYSKNYICLSAEGLQNTKVKTTVMSGFVGSLVAEMRVPDVTWSTNMQNKLQGWHYGKLEKFICRYFD